jgi:hypothetical protein
MGPLVTGFGYGSATMLRTVKEALISVEAATLRRAAIRAIQAPSIHNTQPWKFVLSETQLEIHLDASRRLNVLDPRGRQLVISCGCALMNARVAIAAAGFEPVVERLPYMGKPNVLARISVGRARPAGRNAALDLAIDRRHTNRRAFLGDPVPASVIAKFVAAVRDEGAFLVPISSPEHRALIDDLTTVAARIENEDPDYVEEIRAWTTDDPRRRDGVQAASVPYAGANGGHNGGSAIRSFDVRGMGWLPSAGHLGADECLLVLCAADDEPHGWLKTGEALERLWLELTDFGYWASPLTQLIEVRGTHDRLRQELRLSTFPQLLLRVGRAPDAVRTPRRHPFDVIVEA